MQFDRALMGPSMGLKFLLLSSSLVSSLSEYVARFFWSLRVGGPAVEFMNGWTGHHAIIQSSNKKQLIRLKVIDGVSFVHGYSLQELFFAITFFVSCSIIHSPYKRCSNQGF